MQEEAKLNIDIKGIIKNPHLSGYRFKIVNTCINTVSESTLVHIKCLKADCGTF